MKKLTKATLAELEIANQVINEENQQLFVGGFKGGYYDQYTSTEYSDMYAANTWDQGGWVSMVGYVGPQTGSYVAQTADVAAYNSYINFSEHSYWAADAGSISYNAYQLINAIAEASGDKVSVSDYRYDTGMLASSMVQDIHNIGIESTYAKYGALGDSMLDLYDPELSDYDNLGVMIDLHQDYVYFNDRNNGDPGTELFVSGGYMSSGDIDNLVSLADELGIGMTSTYEGENVSFNLWQ